MAYKDNEYVTYSKKPAGISKDQLENIGEDVLRKIGASDEQIEEAKKGDLAPSEQVDPKENIPDIPEEDEEKLFFLQNPVERKEYEKAKRFLLEYPKGEKPNEDWYKAHYTVWGYEKFANDDQLKEDLKDYITEDERANAPSLVPGKKNRDGYTVMKLAPAQKTIYSEQGLKKKADAIEDGLKTTDELIDTNDNGKIEKDEMADFQKSLDDYASKNKKGREDIPARYRK